MVIKYCNILNVSVIVMCITIFSSCDWEPETFTYEDIGLYTTVERIDSDHFRIYFHDTPENKRLDFVEIFYSVSTEQSPAMNINFSRDNPYIINIKDFGDCIEKVNSSLYDLTISKLVKKTQAEKDSHDYDLEYFEREYRWSDSTVLENDFITYSFEPAFFEMSVLENGKHFIGTAYIVK